MLPTFVLSGVVADWDTASRENPYHPEGIVLIDTGDAVLPIAMPGQVPASIRKLLPRGRPVVVSGVVAQSRMPMVWPHVATSIELVGPRHSHGEPPNSTEALESRLLIPHIQRMEGEPIEWPAPPARITWEFSQPTIRSVQ